MSRTDAQGSNESLDESDLTAAFDLNILGMLAIEQRCSTTRKQQQQLQGEQEAAVVNLEPPVAGEEATPDTVAATEPPPPATPQTPSPPQTPTPPQLPPPARATRRKQPNPLQRAAQFRREVRTLRRSPHFMIPRLSFGRVVREIMLQHTETPYRITVGALEALQTATEMFLTQRFQDSYLMTLHRSRVTLEVRDMALMAFVCKLHGQL
ncbi:histone H3-like centromeric protein cid [Drosophila montana]|uniref:Cid5 n=1 Tax=Drosophila montana TaxID=40370 RepID=A0A1V0HS58_DROMN|nr:Cid5 [Drosophila montana]ARC76901.1 Cid5 [Drosophila montana]ARC76902.1 Cid5 [Drosophila montana]ARC76905.1 Cid5 [Drosophila montana]ARC76906.1 Cid5 [Drosophila montana]